MLRVLIGFSVQCSLFAALILGPAWALRGDGIWPRGWLALAVLASVSGVGALWILKTDPDLARERAAAPRPQSVADGVATGAIAATVIAWFVFAGWDVHQKHLPGLPSAWSLGLGLAIFLAGTALIVWTLRVNSFAVTVVEVQDRREQRVIDTGPYRGVRHPMYLGAIAFFAGVGLLLGSTAAAILALPLFAAAFAPRILAEEAVLRRDLAGYAEYQSRVRTRILPGIF